MHHFLTIEGNIGAGKTTFATRLAAGSNRRLILEAFSDNPFLPAFYREPDRYALAVELFFMAERHRQLQSELTQPELFTNGIVSDYLFVKTLLFARNSLNDEEFRLFSRLYRALGTGFPAPDLIVYLDRPLEALQANIARRGRSYELEMKDDYLRSVHQAYLSYFGTQKEYPVLIIDLGDRDFVSDEALYRRMVDLVGQTYPRGITRVGV